jgi:PTS system beta-glucosides-specific IIC component
MGITSDDGVELLIHIGMNTVELNGKHFTAKAKQGDKISVGDVLVEFDKDAIVSEGYSIETPVLVTNADDFLDMIATEQIAAAFGDTLITIMH